MKKTLTVADRTDLNQSIKRSPLLAYGRNEKQA
jgi:hypothetical protein